MKAPVNITIKTKFSLFLGIIVAVFVVIFLIFVYSLNKVQSYSKFYEKIDNVFINFRDMRQNEHQFLLRYNEDIIFFKTNENKYVKRFEIAYNNIVNLLTELKSHPITSSIELTESFNKINENFNNYNEIYHAIIKAIFQRGSNETGIIGQMKRAVKNSIILCKNEEIFNFIVRLQQYEKSYLVDRDITNYNYFIKSFSELNIYINQNRNDLVNNIRQDSTTADSSQYIDISSKSILAPAFIKNLNDYKRNFLSLVKIDKEIGITSDDGLNGEIKIEINKLEPELNRILKNVNESREEAIKSTMQNLYFLGGFLLLVLIIFIIQLGKSITQPLNKLKSYLHPLSQGILPDDLLTMKGKDELSKMTQSINELIEGLKKTTEFATTIGNGIFNTEFTPLSEKDDLGNSLLEMRKNLVQAQKEEEKRKYEDSLRKWANEGLARFSEIMRQSTNDIESLANNVIKNLVLFLNANQGGLFLINDIKKDDIHLELIAAYAYNQERKKKKKIYIGEGLVGMCAIEKASIYMTEIPNDYLTITSGLGGSNPKSLLIVPLKVEEQIFGVVEIASFNTFEKHEIEFVEKVSESIASTLSIAKINARTAELLEQSQQQAEEMAAQEEEMRQNLEELQATQEESARREAEMVSILNAINASSMVVEFDLNGRIIEVNNAICELFSLTREQMIGRHQGDFEEMDRDKIKSEEFWDRLKRGEVIKETHHLKLFDREVWLHEVYSTILDAEGRPYKILNLATDITESKKQELMLIQQAEIMSSQEEELKRNLEVLQATQEEMEIKQAELEKINEKLTSNEKNLQDLLDKAREQEIKINQKNAELVASEEEIRQNMEELKATQEEMERQHRELEQAKDQLEANESILRKSILKSREQEIKIRTIIDNSYNSICIITKHGIIAEANQTMANQFGYAKSELSGMEITKIFKHLKFDSIKNGDAIHTRVTRKDNSTFMAGGTIAEVIMNEEHYFVFYFKDITTIIQKEQELISNYEIALKQQKILQLNEKELNKRIAQLEEENKKLKNG